MKSLSRSKLFLHFLTGFAFICHAVPAWAQTIVQDQQLSFGTIVVADTGSNQDLVLNSNGGYTNDPGIYVIEPPEPGEYTVTGATPSSNYTVDFNNGGNTLLQLGAATDFQIHDFETLPTNLQSDGSGEFSFSVGATLTSLAAGTYVDGNYNGSLQITVTEDN
jgi:hypothetical protein